MEIKDEEDEFDDDEVDEENGNVLIDIEDDCRCLSTASSADVVRSPSYNLIETANNIGSSERSTRVTTDSSLNILELGFSS